MLGGSVHGSVSRDEIAALFQPDRVQRAVLSPDGDHVGYVVMEPDATFVVLRQVENPDIKTVVRVDLLARAPGTVEVKHLGWASRDWLVYLVALPDREQTWSEELHAIDVRDFKDRLLLKSSQVEFVLKQTPMRTLAPPAGSDGAMQDIIEPDQGREKDPPGEPGVVYASKEQPRAQMILGRDPATEFNLSRHLCVLASDVHVPLVWLEANGTSSADTEVFWISPERRVPISIGRWPGGEHVLYDRMAKPRIIETARSVFSHRQSFRILEANPVPTWRTLDDYLGGDARFSHDDDTDFFGPRTFPLAFDADPNVLYVASNTGSACFRLRRVDLAGRRITDLIDGPVEVDLATPDDAFRDAGLVFDSVGRLAGVRVPGMPGTTRWAQPERRDVQRQIDSLFPGRTVDVLGWNDSGTRVLLLTSGPSDPGRYFIFYPGQRPRAVELARRKSALTAEKLAITRPIDFTTDAGVRLVGSLTLPVAPRRRPPPLVVLCRDIPGLGLVGTAFDPAAQALAAQGFMVLVVNHRGRAGLGTTHREAVRQGFDRMPLEDIRAAMAYVRRHEPFDLRRVALVGEGFGGFLALRALELFPAEFRSAVVLDAPVDLRTWAANDSPRTLLTGASPAGRRAFFAGDPAALASAPSLETGGALSQPILVLRFSGDRAAALKSVLKRRRCDADAYELPAATESRDPRALATAFIRIADFLNGALYDYRVDVGKEEAVP